MFPTNNTWWKLVFFWSWTIHYKVVFRTSQTLWGYTLPHHIKVHTISNFIKANLAFIHITKIIIKVLYRRTIVTSRSCAHPIGLIFWGNLRASDPVLVYGCMFAYGWLWWYWITMLCYFIYMYRHVLLMGFSWVCRTLDRLRMKMASMDLLGLWIESMSGF
jgi:hypothetical protein